MKKCWEIKNCSGSLRSSCIVYTEELESAPEVVNCWDFIKCEESKRNDCIAYINKDGQECWKLTGTRCNEDVILEFKEKIKLCRKCEFFSKHANRPF